MMLGVVLVIIGYYQRTQPLLDLIQSFLVQNANEFCPSGTPVEIPHLVRQYNARRRGSVGQPYFKRVTFCAIRDGTA